MTHFRTFEGTWHSPVSLSLRVSQSLVQRRNCSSVLALLLNLVRNEVIYVIASVGHHILAEVSNAAALWKSANRGRL